MTTAQPAPQVAAPTTLTAEVVWHRLISIVEECETVSGSRTCRSRRSSARRVTMPQPFSTRAERYWRRLRRESARLSRSSVVRVGRCWKMIPPESLRPGDVLVTNDPWVCAGHLPDVMTMSPIFLDDKIVGYATSIAHMSDLGGQISAEARDLFEEGLRITPASSTAAANPTKTGSASSAPTAAPHNRSSATSKPKSPPPH